MVEPKTHYLLLACPSESKPQLDIAAGYVAESIDAGDPAPYPAMRDGEQWGWWSAAAVGDTTVSLLPLLTPSVPGVIVEPVRIEDFTATAIAYFLSDNNLTPG